MRRHVENRVATVLPRQSDNHLSGLNDFLDDVALSRAIYREDYHAILVDAATGIDATRAVFARRACYGDRRAPLIVIGAFADRDSIERAFEVGADDVVLSPIDQGELEVRTYQALRRFQSPPPLQSEDRAELGPYRLDRRTGTVLVDDPERALTMARSMAAGYYEYSPALFDPPRLTWTGPDPETLKHARGVWPDFHHAADLELRRHLELNLCIGQIGRFRIPVPRNEGRLRCRTRTGRYSCSRR